MSNKALFAIALVLCALVQVSVQRSEVVPDSVITLMASRKMRYHHFLWHNLRENWFGLEASTQHAIRALGWEPPRPTLIYSTGQEVIVENNGAGEDFFWMHRQMIIEVNKLVADTDYEKVVGWKNAPYPGDPKWPVPAKYVTGDAGLDAMIEQRKTDDYFWNTIQPTDELLHDHDYLRSISLAELGNQVEYGVHRDLHLRFSDPGVFNKFRPVTPNPTPNVSIEYDDPQYRWLGDTYSSHVNPIFWKIHGWVDDHIEAWRIANGLDKIEWKYTWENGPEATIENLFAAGDVRDDGDADPDASDEVDHHMDIMEQAVKILLKANVKDTFRRDVRSKVIDIARNRKF